MIFPKVGVAEPGIEGRSLGSSPVPSISESRAGKAPYASCYEQRTRDLTFSNIIAFH